MSHPSKDDGMSETGPLDVKTRSAGQVVFVIFGCLASLFLMTQLGTQTDWSDRARTIAAQPRFWPTVAISTMVISFSVHWRLMARRRPNSHDWVEVRRWSEPLEFLGWFILYVFAVPRLGFLPMSLVFASLLTWRLGYRTGKALWVACLFALSITVIFKGLLGVNIPGGQIYNLLPGGIRTFFLVYL